MPRWHFIGKLDSEAKVSNFEVHAVIEERIANLEVSVYNAFILHVLHTINQLPQKIPAFYLAQISAPMKQLVHRLVRANLKQQVDVLGVFEEVFKAHDIFMFQTHLDGDFLFKFFLSVLRLQSFLRDDFASEYPLILADPRELEAGRKCTLTQLFALDVFGHSSISCHLFDDDTLLLVNGDLCIFVLERRGQFK